MQQDQDQSFYKTFPLFLLAFIALLFIFLVIAQWVTPDNDEGAAYKANKVAELTKPVGEVITVSEEVGSSEAISVPTDEQETAPLIATAVDEVTPATEINGEAIYNSLCIACHSVSGIGAPVLGDAADWASRIAKGMDVLYENAINGFVGPEGFMMPAKGGGNFSDEEVKAAVDYMIKNSQ